MNSGKKLIYYIFSSLIIGSSFAGCGTESSYLPTTYVSYQSPVSTTNECCCCCEDGTQGTTEPISTTSNKWSEIKTSSTPSPKASANTSGTATTEVKASPAPSSTPASASPTPAPSAEDSKSKGRKILDKVLATITTPNSYITEADKFEKGLKSDNRTVTQTFKVWDKKPGKVKVLITKHSKASSVGAIVVFNTGTGKATIRPGGALSFITKEMDQTDSNLVSPNGYTPEQIDFFYMSKRMGDPSYDAELTGKTTVNGQEVYILKITKKTGTNELDSIIKYENIGFDMKTFQVKYWEAYSDKNGADAFFRINILSFTVTDIADSEFKV